MQLGLSGCGFVLGSFMDLDETTGPKTHEMWVKGTTCYPFMYHVGYYQYIPGLWEVMYAFSTMKQSNTVCYKFRVETLTLNKN